MLILDTISDEKLASSLALANHMLEESKDFPPLGFVVRGETGKSENAWKRIIAVLACEVQRRDLTSKTITELVEMVALRQGDDSMVRIRYDTEEEMWSLYTEHLRVQGRPPLKDMLVEFLSDR